MSAGALAGCQHGTCGQCRRGVVWVRLDTGGKMPIDPAVDEAGTVAAYRDHTGAAVGYVLKKDQAPDRGHSRYVTHFATCIARQPKPAPAARASSAVPDNVVPLSEYRARAGGHRGGLGLPGARRGR